MKRLLIVAAAAAGALAYREWRRNEESRAVWADVTDSVEKEN
ncbi:DLW-39 family protein [Nesterenkonia populi]|nr:DLW-39 family protein [Nesterenkonia populi]